MRQVLHHVVAPRGPVDRRITFRARLDLVLLGALLHNCNVKDQKHLKIEDLAFSHVTVATSCLTRAFEAVLSAFADLSKSLQVWP